MLGFIKERKSSRTVQTSRLSRSRSGSEDVHKKLSASSETIIWGWKMANRLLIGVESRLTIIYGRVVENDRRKLHPIGPSNMVYAAWTGRADLAEHIVNLVNTMCSQVNFLNVSEIASMFVKKIEEEANFEEGIGFALAGCLPGDNYELHLFKIDKEKNEVVCNCTPQYCVTLGSGSVHLPNLSEQDMIRLGNMHPPTAVMDMLQGIHVAATQDWGSGGDIYHVSITAYGEVEFVRHQKKLVGDCDSGYRSPEAVNNP